MSGSLPRGVQEVSLVICSHCGHHRHKTGTVELGGAIPHAYLEQSPKKKWGIYTYLRDNLGGRVIFFGDGIGKPSNHRCLMSGVSPSHLHQRWVPDPSSKAVKRRSSLTPAVNRCNRRRTGTLKLRKLACGVSRNRCSLILRIYIYTYIYITAQQEPWTVYRYAV